MSEKDRGGRNELSFQEKLHVRDFLINNHKIICQKGMTGPQVAAEAEKVLGFPVTVGNIPGIVQTIPNLEWPFFGVKMVLSKDDFEELEKSVGKLREEFGITEMALTDVNTKIAELEVRLSSASKEIGDLWSKVDGSMKDLAQVNANNAATIAEMRRTIAEIRTTVESFGKVAGFSKIASLIGPPPKAEVSKSTPPK